jgi:HlyD family secretion protein
MKKITFKKISRKKIVKGAIFLAILGLAAFYFTKRNRTAAEDVPAFTANAEVGRVETSITGKGTLSPADQYEVKSLVKGELLLAPFEEGDEVKKGQLLYQISTSDIENSIKAAELNVDRAKLVYEDYVDKQGNLEIMSRESGYITKLYVKEGELLQPGTAIADLYNADTMYIDLYFPSYEASASWVGKPALVALEATGESVEGTVTGVNKMEEVLEGGILVKKVTISIKDASGIKAGDLAEAAVSEVTSSSTGAFRAETAVTLIAETSGRIDGISVKEGQWIKQRDKILSLSSKEIGVQIESADLSIREAELGLETQKNQMEQYAISAPISGKVITKNKKQGDTIDPATDVQNGPMAIIYDMTYLTFDMNIDELQISSIRVGQKVTVRTEAFPESEFEGVIEKISLKGITGNGVTSYPVTIRVNEYKNLLPGMNVTGKIVIEEADKVLTIPSSALQRDNTVYVQQEGAVSEKDSGIPEGFVVVPVEIGINDGSSVEIISGLKEGDIVYVPFDLNAGAIDAAGAGVVVE